MSAETRDDLAKCIAERHSILSRIRQLESEGSVRASYVEKLETQVRALDAWVARYRGYLASDRGGVMAADHAAVLMDRTFLALEGPRPREVTAAVAQPRGDRLGPSNARPFLYSVPLEPDERQ